MAFRDASRCKHNVKMKQKDTKISYFAAHITTIVSVTLVLIIVGVIAMISVCGAGVGRQVKEQIEISAIMKDSVANEQALALCEQLKSQSYVNTIDFMSKEEAMQNWTRDTGENLEELIRIVDRRLATLPPILVYEREYDESDEFVKNAKETTIRRENDKFYVEGEWLYNLMGQINFDNYESLDYFQRVLQKSGVFSSLEERGCTDGHTVSIYGFEFDYVK
jgi:Obg family GTPase CgtA-like protein